MKIGNTFVALSIAAALAPFSAGCSEMSDPEPTAVASTDQALTTGAYEIAYQGYNDGDLWETGQLWSGNTHLGMMAGTSPSITVLNGGGREAAMQDNTGILRVTGDQTTGPTPLGMWPGTSPSIAGLIGGGYLVAFEAAGTANLWFYGGLKGAETWGDMHYGMAPGTSPSIAGLTGGGYAIAFQTNQASGNQLWIFGTGGEVRTGLPMMAGTSPSITGLTGGGYEVAFQGSDGYLHVYGSVDTRSTGYGMWSSTRANTSPSITAMPANGYEVAFQANTGDMWVTGTAGTIDSALGMMAGTNPSIAALPGGTFQVVFQDNTGYLYYAGAQTSGRAGDHLKNLTSPSISPVYSAPTGLKASAGVLYGSISSCSSYWNRVPGADHYVATQNCSGTVNTRTIQPDPTGPPDVEWGADVGFSETCTYTASACFANGMCFTSSINYTTPKNPNPPPPPPPTTGGISVYYELHAPAPNATCGTATFVLDSTVYESASGYWQQLSENQQPYSASGWCQYNWGFSLVKPGAHTVCVYVGDPNTKSCASESVVAGSTASARING